MKQLYYYGALILTTTFWFLADQASKAWAQAQDHLPWGNPEGWFYLSQVTHNPGIAFGLPVPRWIQLLTTVLVVGFLIYTAQLWRQKNAKPFLQALVFGIVLGGALGNFWDRLRQGYVVDFIVLKPFPNFNLADIGLTVGLIGLVFLEWRRERN